MTEHHHFQIILHQIQQAQQENPAEARRRAHVREVRRGPRAAVTSSRRTLISGLKRRSGRRASSPCPDAGVPC